MENMIPLQSQPTQENFTPLTEDEIYKQVLGTRLGYVRGLGHGAVGLMTPPSPSSCIYNYQRVEELTKMVTAAERQAQELVEQLQRMEAQRLQMEAQMVSRDNKWRLRWMMSLSHGLFVI